MKIVQVKYASPKIIRELEYGYCLVLESLLDLAKYDAIAKGVYETGFNDALKTLEGNHAATQIGHAVYITAKHKGKSIIESFIDVTSKAFQAKWRAIENLGKVYIQPNGSSFFVPCENWKCGNKGRGGTFEVYGKTIYGYYQPSRDWCDEELKKNGYELPEEKGERE